MLRFVLQGEDPTLDALAARLAALEGGERTRPRRRLRRRRASPPDRAPARRSRVAAARAAGNRAPRR